MLRLIFHLSFVEFRMRDQGTFLGFLWTLLKPLALFVALYAVFQPSFAGRVASFNTYLLSGIIFWDFFSVASQTGASILFRRPHFLLSATAHPNVYCIGSILSIFYANAIEALLAGIFLWAIGQPGLSFSLHLILGLVLTLPIVYGCACILAALTTVFLDTGFLWALVLRIGFFLTPVFYPLTLLSERMAEIVKLNPLFYPLAVARSADDGICISVCVGLVLATVGAYIFHRCRYRFAEVV